MKTEIWEYDMYERYINCGLCGHQNPHTDEKEGDILECVGCDKTSLIGSEYEDEALNKEE